jgi:hypothetical protein
MDRTCTCSRDLWIIHVVVTWGVMTEGWKYLTVRDMFILRGKVCGSLVGSPRGATERRMQFSTNEVVTCYSSSK